MKFFVPSMRDRREKSEWAWLLVRGWLAENGKPTTRRRIQALVAEIDGADHYMEIVVLGDEHQSFRRRGSRDLGGRGLPTPSPGHVLGIEPALPKPAAQSRRELRVH